MLAPRPSRRFLICFTIEGINIMKYIKEIGPMTLEQSSRVE